MFSVLTGAWCSIYNSPLIAFVIGCVVLFFFAAIAIGTGDGRYKIIYSSAIRLLIGCCGLVSVSAVVPQLFGITVLACSMPGY